MEIIAGWSRFCLVAISLINSLNIGKTILTGKKIALGFLELTL